MALATERRSTTLSEKQNFQAYQTTAWKSTFDSTYHLHRKKARKEGFGWCESWRLVSDEYISHDTSITDQMYFS